MSQAGAPLNIREEKGSVVLEVLVVPRSSKCAVVGVHDGRLKITLDAPPVDGQANETLVAFVAKALGLPKRDVRILRGEKGRKKTLSLHGVTLREAHEFAASANG